MKYNYADNTALRIALLLDRQTNKTIKNFNKEINKNINPDITFGSKCLPHITLMSGVLKNRNDFNTVCQIIKQTISKELTEKLIIDFSEFYSSEDNTWLFLKTKENHTLQNLINQIKENLKEYFIISDARKIHVTIAKSNELNKKEKEIKHLSIPKEMKANTICIGLRGENGVLINAIKKFKI